jgi:primosomal protein N'
VNEYNIDEKVFYMLQNMKNILNENGEHILQTRIKNKLLENINTPDYFYKIELENRKINKLPPYSYILTFESENDINIPEFLKSFTNYKIRLKVKENKFKNKIINVYRYIIIIDKSVWEIDNILREKCFLNLYNLNYKVNPENVFN